jgi:hypothetical protein
LFNPIAAIAEQAGAADERIGMFEPAGSEFADPRLARLAQGSPAAGGANDARVPSLGAPLSGHAERGALRSENNFFGQARALPLPLFLVSCFQPHCNPLKQAVPAGYKVQHV